MIALTLDGSYGSSEDLVSELDRLGTYGGEHSRSMFWTYYVMASIDEVGVGEAGVSGGED